MSTSAKQKQYSAREKISFGIAELITKTYFHSVIARMFTLVPTTKLSTMGVRMIGLNKIELQYNEDFVNKLNSDQLATVLQHECCHVALGHLNQKASSSWMAKVKNYAFDLAINSELNKDHVLQMRGLYPGEGNFKMLEVGKSHLYYQNYILENMEDPKSDSEGEEPSNFDEHLQGEDENGNVIDGLSEAQKESLAKVMSNAVAQADAVTNGWGNMSASMIRKIRRFARGTYNWKAVLRNIIQTRQTHTYFATYSRPSRRLPGLLPGKKRDKICRVLVAVDESGSVSNEMWAKMMKAISSLSKYATFDILPFDSEIAPSRKVSFEKDSVFAISRSMCGGTNFSPPTEYFNENIKDYDVLFVVTDGEAAKPIDAKKKRVWIMPSECDILWESSEQVVKISD